MRKHYFFSLIGLILFSANVFAQTQSVTYQGIAINDAGQRMKGLTINMQLTVHSGSLAGPSVYVEIQSPTTDATGVYTLQVGQGTPVSGSFAAINWGASSYFLMVEMTPKTPISSSGPITTGANTFNVGAAVLTTTAATNITNATASSGGTITSDGGSAITARGICYATTANPTLANTSIASGSGVGSFAVSITGLTLSTLYHVRAYATNSLGLTYYGNDLSFTTSAWVCGTSTLTVNHLAGSVAPISKSVTYGTVTNIPGATSKCWITSNLGADHQATAVDDATEASAGWYWQFNRKQGYKHDGTTRTPNTSWINPINENSDWLTSNDPCTSELGAGWRLPTRTEWTNVDATGNWTTWTGPWASGLKLHAAGCLNYGDGSLSSRGSFGGYWSSSQDGSDIGWGLNFNGGYSSMGYSSKAPGFSVRCIKD